MPNSDQFWTHTDEDGHSVTIVATPSGTVGDEKVFEITEQALQSLLTRAGFTRDGGE